MYSQLYLHSLSSVLDTNIDTSSQWISKHKETLKEISNVCASLTSGNYELSLISSGNYGDYKDIKFVESHVRELHELGKFDDFKQHFQDVFEYYQVEPYTRDGKLSVKLLDKRRENNIEYLSTTSFGVKRVFKLLSQVCVNKAPLISIEDLENGINPRIYTNLIREFYKCINNNNNTQKLIITTHAPGVMDNFSIKSVYLGIPSFGEKAMARFCTLSTKGMNEIKKLVDNSEDYLKIGDYIFSICLESETDKDAETEGWYDIGASQ